MKRILTIDDVEAAIAGGSIFAAGGGGWPDHGRMLGQAAVMTGQPELVTLDEVPDDAIIATAAAIGAPAGTTDWQMLGIDYVRAVELLQDALGKTVYGLMIGQNGMSSTLNAWLPGAILGTKVIDAVGDIRAHPTGDMGSIGLASSPEATIQTAAGGNRSRNAYIELVVRGTTAKVSPILRTASDMSGGFIASCRTPFPPPTCANTRPWWNLDGIGTRRTDPGRKAERRPRRHRCDLRPDVGCGGRPRHSHPKIRRVYPTGLRRRHRSDR